MDRADNWNLILKLCEETDDDVIVSLRLALLSEFSKANDAGWAINLRHLAACLRTFLPNHSVPDMPPIRENLPLILFPYATGSNMLNLMPVAREAQRRGMLGGVVAGDVKPDELREFDNVVTAQALRGRVGVAQLPEIAREVWRSFNELIELIEKYDTRCALRVRRSYGEILRQMVLSRRMRVAFSELLSLWKPSCVISTSDYWPSEFQLFCQAKRRGIPTAMIQHGDLSSVSAWPTYADTFLVWGEVFREQLLRLGAPEERIRVCGMPASDGLFLRATHAEVRAVNRASPVCLVFSHAHDRWEEPELFEQFARYLAEAIHLTPGVRWRIKLHPAEDDSFYREHKFIGGNRVEVLSPNISLQDAVEQADVACTIRSTAGLEAMMMQRPVVVIDLPANKNWPVWWPLQGGGLAAKTAQAFQTILDRLINDPGFRGSVLDSQRAFLDKSFNNKGRAAASVVDYLEEQTVLRFKIPLATGHAEKSEVEATGL